MVKPNYIVFANAILAGSNQRQAAIAAGFDEKYAAQNGLGLWPEKMYSRIW